MFDTGLRTFKFCRSLPASRFLAKGITLCPVLPAMASRVHTSEGRFRDVV